MIPIRDSIQARRYPLVNNGIIALNIVIFLYQVTLGPQGSYQFILAFAVIPQEVTGLLLEGPAYRDISPALSLVTATFLHGGWLHLIGNMLYLWVFGDNIEDCLGSFRYLLTYLFMGIAATLVHIYFHPFSEVPLIGASGAIAGVLGAYFILYPWSKVTALIPLGFFFTFVEVPAVLYLIFWFIIQLFSGLTASLLSPDVSVIAWWAHVGGFACGVAAGIAIKVLGLSVRCYR